jgi:hypothetical protein
MQVWEMGSGGRLLVELNWARYLFGLGGLLYRAGSFGDWKMVVGGWTARVLGLARLGWARLGWAGLGWALGRAVAFE